MGEKEISNIAIESLVTIEIRVWVRRHLGFEFSMAEIAAVRTIGSLVEAMMKGLCSKYQSQENGDEVVTGVSE